MAEKIYTLAEETIRKLKADHLRLMAMYRNLETRLRILQREGNHAYKHVGKIVDADIAAMSGTTPGKGRVEVYKENSDGELVSAGWFAENVSNMGNTAATEDSWCHICWEQYGTWQLDVVFCTE